MAYLLRREDILRLTTKHLTEEGIILNISKNETLRLMEWSGNLRKATQNLIEASRQQLKRNYSGHLSEYLMHTREGLPYKGSGVRSIFSRIMAKALEQKILTSPFCDHDIRAKAGSDAGTVADAKKLLVHLSDRVTQKHYRRKIERIQPLM